MSKHSCSWSYSLQLVVSHIVTFFKAKFIQWLCRVFSTALLLFVLPSKSFRFTWRHVYLSFSNERLLMPSGGTRPPSPRQRTERPEHDNYHGGVQVKRAVNHTERRLVILAHCITGLDQRGRRRNPPWHGPAVLRPDWSVRMCGMWGRCARRRAGGDGFCGFYPQTAAHLQTLESVS